ncbi:hypothetical protein ACH347_36675 [Saccharopolyspora sp. 5N102]|uniref:hypothetical protein n=1 Tax=Saccharopolyspora sp. 5N102 TaxID=3375155 RepID=UPI0037B5D5FE
MLRPLGREPATGWKNPITGQRKDYGRVVDYIGLAKAIGESLVGPKPKADEPDELHVVDVSQLVAKFMGDLTKLDAMFTGIDKTDSDFASLAEAHERIKDGTPQRDAFVEGFVSIQTVWEFLDPNPMLAPFKGAYYWLAKVYESIRPKDVSKAFLWERLGTKTRNLIHDHMSNVTVRANPTKNVTLDAAGLELIKKIAEELKVPDIESQDTKPADVYQEVLDSIERRVPSVTAAETIGM